ncbi:MAG: hypothetical protein IJG17_05985, partial [Eubacterium sp.]|nr:hypothetical protein [Eubacterium sp.]
CAGNEWPPFTNLLHTYRILVRSSMAFPVERTENTIVVVRRKRQQTARQIPICMVVKYEEAQAAIK